MAPAGQEGSGRTFNVLCLFSGEERMASKAGYKVLLEEWDILRNPDHDLTDEGKRRGVIIVMRRMVAGDLGQSLRAQASARRNKALGVPLFAGKMESGGQELISRQRSLWRDQGDHQEVLQGLAEPGKRPGDVLADDHRFLIPLIKKRGLE